MNLSVESKKKKKRKMYLFKKANQKSERKKKSGLWLPHWRGTRGDLEEGT